MIANNVMTKQVEACTLNDSMEKALEVMRRKNCGFVPIIDSQENHKLIGVVTDRDLAIFLGWSKRRANEAHLRECYSADVKWVTPETSVQDIAHLMAKYQIHRMPVADKNERLVGVVSLKDLADKARIDRGTVQPEVTEKQIGEIVELISDCAGL